MGLSSVKAGGALAAPEARLQAGFAIVAESAADAGQREALLDRAMGPKWKTKTSQKLRRGRRPSPGLAFVARAADGSIAGTVRLWDVRAGKDGPPALLLGPLAVDPALKGAGLGSALMRHALGEAGRLGHRAVVLVGDAAFYGRFGFSAEKTASMSMPGPYEQHRFLAKELVEGALDGADGTLEPTGRPARAEGAASGRLGGGRRDVFDGTGGRTGIASAEGLRRGTESVRDRRPVG